MQVILARKGADTPFGLMFFNGVLDLVVDADDVTRPVAKVSMFPEEAFVFPRENDARDCAEMIAEVSVGGVPFEIFPWEELPTADTPQGAADGAGATEQAPETGGSGANLSDADAFERMVLAIASHLVAVGAAVSVGELRAATREAVDLTASRVPVSACRLTAPEGVREYPACGA